MGQTAISLITPTSGGLAAAGLTKRFGKTLAVDHLDFDVAPHQILALLGPNGAGRTTPLMCLARLLRPDSGRITWQGVELGPTRGRQVALITETPEVYEMLTVWEHMVFVGRSCLLPAGWQDRAENLLQRMGMADQRDTMGGALSKGMRQRVLIAATLLAATPILLLDEPMIGLDPRGQHELRNLLVEVRDQGTTVSVSTHLRHPVFHPSACHRLQPGTRAGAADAGSAGGSAGGLRTGAGRAGAGTCDLARLRPPAGGVPVARGRAFCHRGRARFTRCFHVALAANRTASHRRLSLAAGPLSGPLPPLARIQPAERPCFHGRAGDVWRNRLWRPPPRLQSQAKRALVCGRGIRMADGDRRHRSRHGDAGGDQRQIGRAHV